MKVRGDDELLELLAVMGGDHEEPDAARGASDSHDDMSPRKTSPEPSPAATGANEDACVPETGWNSSIWNPHVFETAAPATGIHDDAGATREGMVRFVSPQEEVLRQQAVAVVFSRFQVLGKELGIRPKNEMFERWQFSRKLKEGREGDPILPAESFFDPGLDAELQELGVHKSQSRNVCCELGRASKSALKTLRKQLRGVVNTPSAGGAAGRGKGGSSSKGVSVKRVDESTFVLQLGKNKLRMNSAHYAKMKELFRRACGHGTASNPSLSSNAASLGGKARSPVPDWIGQFHDCLFACLMRYEALQGGGFQASMGGDAFDVLLKRLGVKMECFASPFNCRYSRYCSAFADTDKPFGSVGSFFDFRPTEGAYEANPPFVRGVILKMAKHMEDLLQGTSKALTFVVIIPCWEDSAGWIRLRDSAFLSNHFTLDQKDHGYCEGKQHLRRNRYRLASFHTSVFFLQTEAARQQQGPRTLEQACQELQRAFALRQEADGSGGGGDGDDGGGGIVDGGDAPDHGKEVGGADGPSFPSSSSSSSSIPKLHERDGGDNTAAELEKGAPAKREEVKDVEEDGHTQERGASAGADEDVGGAAAGGGGVDGDGAGRRKKKRKGAKGDRRRKDLDGGRTGAEPPPAGDTQSRGVGSEKGSYSLVDEGASSLSTSTEVKKKPKKRKMVATAGEEGSTEEARGSAGGGAGGAATGRDGGRAQSDVRVGMKSIKAPAESAAAEAGAAAAGGQAAGTKRKKKKKRVKGAGKDALPAP